MGGYPNIGRVLPHAGLAFGHAPVHLRPELAVLPVLLLHARIHVRRDKERMALGDPLVRDLPDDPCQLSSIPRSVISAHTATVAASSERARFSATRRSRETRRFRDLYAGRASVEREFGRLKNEYGLKPLRIRGLAKVALHTDLTMLARLSQALARARAVPLAA